jgi:hypothetical protein
LRPEREPLTDDDFLQGEFILVRKGARAYGLVRGRATGRR